MNQFQTISTEHIKPSFLKTLVIDPLKPFIMERKKWKL